ncbi:MAG: hypothetical protein Sapg2KO_40680 [Saprospiraceae bacterium]
MPPEYSKEETNLLKHSERYLERYFIKRDPSLFTESPSIFFEGLTGFGAEANNVFKDFNSLWENAKKEYETVPPVDSLYFQWKEVKIIEDVGVFFGEMTLKWTIENKPVILSQGRVSFIWHKTGDHWHIIHGHFSLPYDEKGDERNERVEKLQVRTQELEQLISERTNALKKEKEKTESLLHNILPAEIAKELLETGKTKPKRFEEVTILFSDFKEFTNIVATIPTKKLITELNEIFSEFDEIMEKEGIEKIQTVGDAYLAACGLPTEIPDHAEKCVRAGKKMIEFLSKRNKKSAIKWKIRIGLHSGPIAAGVVGKKKFAYDIFGDTINTASRIETAGEEGKINVSAYTYDLIKEKYPCEYRGKINAKGKGDLDMYFVK